MSNLMRTQAQPGLPTPPRGDTIASYRTYAEAQRAVDFLADNNFAVQAVTIVGVDLRMVERVTGRLTYARVAVAGLVTGAWFGVFIGLLFSLTSSGTAAWLAAVPLGAAFGMAFGLISYALTGGRRDFSSTSQIVANEYRVLCLTEQAGQAIQLLRRLDGGAGVSDAPQPLPGYPSPGHSSPAQPSHPSEPPTAADAGSMTADGHPPAEQPGPPPSGPTYSEMIERKRQEERDAAERDQP